MRGARAHLRTRTNAHVRAMPPDEVCVRVDATPGCGPCQIDPQSRGSAPPPRHPPQPSANAPAKRETKETLRLWPMPNCLLKGARFTRYADYVI